MANLKAVEFEDFVNFLGTLNSQGKACSFCGESSWRLTASFETDVDGVQKRLSPALAYATIKQPGSEEKRELMLNNADSMLIKECGNCGHIELFRYKTVLDYLNSRSEEEGSKDDGE
ncbi:hypothetical protein ACTUSX_04190 [Pantoea ananatis]|uniref:hypothetical protein n=1 Tax=Pantoea ananas TaxID=553 RepID=UPI003FA48864